MRGPPLGDEVAGPTSGRALAARECLVVGAGPAGLAVGAELRRRGVEVLILERADAIVPAWRARYDGFHLNTSSWFSYLPRARLRGAGRWPSRDSLVSYYDRYAARQRLEVSTSADVERLERRADGWAAVAGGEVFHGGSVVVATGKYRTPVIPDWPGREAFTGRLLHAAAYRNPAPHRGESVLVAGAGNSGFEIALALHRGGAADVVLSIRTPPHIINRNIGPLPSDLFAVLGRRLPTGVVDRAAKAIRRLTIGDLSEHGLPEPDDGLYTRLERTGMIPTADGRFVEAVKSGEIAVVGAVEAFDGPVVRLAGGERVRPDTVIAATGYARDLEPLVGHLGVLARDGRPLVNGAASSPAAPGLYFIGFSEPLSGNLRQIRLDAKAIARAIGGLRRRRGERPSCSVVPR